ncbi:MAG: formate dehydrogenase (NAD+) [Cyphobasidiales sp. Tagirdzhanova-0007]|nr:MAG: formate dehydrogenase (NAD+) [Cyphobasidiales sp. Tagirdzhanova-0007]
MKVLAVLYKGGEHAKEEPRLLGTIENSLGIKEWLEQQGHSYKVIFDKASCKKIKSIPSKRAQGQGSPSNHITGDSSLESLSSFNLHSLTVPYIHHTSSAFPLSPHFVIEDIADLLRSHSQCLSATLAHDGENSEFQKEIVDADILITTPFHPGYATRAVIEKAKNLKACITAGVGSDHIDLNAANERKILVAEVTGSNVVSVAEHVIMTILVLVRNYTPAHEQIMGGGWDVAGVAKNAFDLENKVIGTLGAGRIGFRVLQRLKPFDPKELLYYDYQPLPKHAEAEVGAKRIEDLKEFLGKVDVLTINAPLHEGTMGLINKEKISWMKDGAWIVNTARGAICNAEDVAAAVKSGKLRGYGGDVWPQQPAPKDHPWRSMRYQGKDTSGGNGQVMSSDPISNGIS